MAASDSLACWTAALNAETDSRNMWAVGLFCDKHQTETFSVDALNRSVFWKTANFVGISITGITGNQQHKLFIFFNIKLNNSSIQLQFPYFFMFHLKKKGANYIMFVKGNK